MSRLRNMTQPDGSYYTLDSGDEAEGELFGPPSYPSQASVGHHSSSTTAGLQLTENSMPDRAMHSLNIPSNTGPLSPLSRIGNRSPEMRQISPSAPARHLDVEEEDSIVRQVEDNPYLSRNTINEESHSEKLWKRSLYLLMEDPSSSALAFAVNLALAGTILFAVILTTIETIPAIRELQWNIWFRLELFTVVIFSIELLLRTAAHSGNKTHLTSFLKAPLTILDLLAIIPFYITLFTHHDTSVEFRFTILRVFRLFRLFRAYKYSNLLQLSIEVMIIAVRKSLDALGALFFFMIITIILFSTFLYFAERGIWDAEKKAFVMASGNPSTFDSIPSAFWFVIVTITTTGYGDIVPVTLLGKFIAFPLMMLGILLIALPSVIVGRNFTVVWDVLKYRHQSNTNARQASQTQTLSEMMEGIELDLANDHPYTDNNSRVATTNTIAESDHQNLLLHKQLIKKIDQLQAQHANLEARLLAAQTDSAAQTQQLNQLLSQLLKNNNNFPHI